MNIVKVYTGRKKLKNKNKYVKYSDAYFNNNIELSDLTELDKKIIREIDGVVILDNGEVRTSFGLCTIYDLSSGTKTLINVLHYKNKIFDVTCCGGNALELLFILISNKDISIVLSHSEFHIPDNLTLLVDEEHYINFFYDYSVILNRVGI